MRHVYVSHPFTAPTAEAREENRRDASRWAAKIALELECAPACSWIVLTGEWDEATGRRLGLMIDCAQIDRSDALLLTGKGYEVAESRGCQVEKAHALAMGIPVVDLTGHRLDEPIPPSILSAFRQPLGPTHAALTAEVTRARRKFPGSRFMLAALMEEVGELAQAILQKKPRGEIQKEAIQVACCATRIFEEGDPSFDSLTDAESSGAL